METTYSILGDMSVQAYFVLFFFMLFGLVFIRVFELATRKKGSERTPEKFSFKFWLQDNWQSILLSVMTMFLTVRFSSEFLPEGQVMSEWWALLIGGGLDGIIVIAAKKLSWFTNKGKVTYKKEDEE